MEFFIESYARLRRTLMVNRMDKDWLQGRVSLGTAAQWTAEEMRLVAELGYALAEQGRNAEAITVFEGLAALTPATVYFQAALGALWLREKDPEQALSYLDVAISSDPNDISSLINRGEAQMQLGNIEAARKDLREVVRLGSISNLPVAEKCTARALGLLARLELVAEARA